MLHYSDNTKDYIKMLERSHGGLAISGSQTVNEGAERIKTAYEGELDKFTLRNKFTKGAIKINLSKPQRSTGEFRQLKNINAVVGVRKLKAGKEHYLKLQEEGATKKGGPLTLNKVAFPLNAARKSGLYNQPIGGRFRLFSNLFQQPTVGGQPFGVNDKFSPRQRFAIANRIITTGKMFIMKTAYGLAVFAKTLGHIEAVRDLQKNTVNIKPTLKFAKSVNKVSQFTLQSIFIKNAKKFMSH